MHWPSLVLLITLACSCGVSPEEALLREIAAAPEDPRLGMYEGQVWHYNYNQRIVLGPHRVFSHYATGCHVEKNWRGGRWRIQGARVHLNFDDHDVKDRTYRWVPWDRAAFLVPEDFLPIFVSGIEGYREGRIFDGYVLARRDSDEPLVGYPDLSAPWKERATSKVETRLLGLEPLELEWGGTSPDEFHATLEGDASTGLWEGLRLRNKDNGNATHLTVENLGDGTSRGILSLGSSRDIDPGTLLGALYRKGESER